VVSSDFTLIDAADANLSDSARSFGELLFPCYFRIIF
jgi:hypothetical protein